MVQITTSPDLQEMKVAADTDNVLRRGLSERYERPLESALREYIINGYDAHITAGVNEPIEVILDTTDKNNPTVSIRDYGTGMSHDFLTNSYVHYNTSSKRNDNATMGKFGNGAKAGFAVSDFIDVVSTKDGITSHVLMIATVEQMGYKDLGSEPTPNKPNGTTVTIKVGRQTSLRTVKSLLEKFVKYTNLVLRFRLIENAQEVSNTLIEDHTAAPKFSTNRMDLYPTHDWHPWTRIRLGEVVYDINGSLLKPISHILKLNGSYTPVYKFEPKELETNATREEILKTEENLDKIINVIKQGYRELSEELVKYIDYSKNGIRGLDRLMSIRRQSYANSPQVLLDCANLTATETLPKKWEIIWGYLDNESTNHFNAVFSLDEYDRVQSRDSYWFTPKNFNYTDTSKPNTALIYGADLSNNLDEKHIRTWLRNHPLTATGNTIGNVICVYKPKGQIEWLKWDTNAKHSEVSLFSIEEIREAALQIDREKRGEAKTRRKERQKVLDASNARIGSKTNTELEEGHFITSAGAMHVDDIKALKLPILRVWRSADKVSLVNNSDKDNENKYQSVIVIKATEVMARNAFGRTKVHDIDSYEKRGLDNLLEIINPINMEIYNTSAKDGYYSYGQLRTLETLIDNAVYWKKLRDPSLRKAMKQLDKNRASAKLSDLANLTGETSNTILSKAFIDILHKEGYGTKTVGYRNGTPYEVEIPRTYLQNMYPLADWYYWSRPLHVIDYLNMAFNNAKRDGTWHPFVPVTDQDKE